MVRGRVTTNFEGVDVVPVGAITGCHCSVPWRGKGRVTANFGGVDVVPLEGAIVASVTTNFGGVDVVPNGIQKKHPEKLP